MAFRAVFARVSSTDPFQPRFGARLLLYPIDYTLLDAAQFEAVATASIHAGVERPYFAGYGGEEAGWGGTYGHRLVDVRSYDDYRYDDDGFIIIEHFLFAPRGECALVTSYGEYAIVAGTETFLDDLRSALGYDEVRALGVSSPIGARSGMEAGRWSGFRGFWIMCSGLVRGRGYGRGLPKISLRAC